MRIKGWTPREGAFSMVAVTCENGRFTEVEDLGEVSGEPPDSILLPGFVDVHNHGAAGIDVNSSDAEGLVKIGKFLVSRGVTAWVPTIVPDSPEKYAQIIESIDKAMSQQGKHSPAASILGVHYEGVFANEQMCGALHKEHFRSYTGAEQLESLPVPAEGIRMMTLAPEVEGGIELIKRLRENGWIASIGHTRADLKTLKAALLAGARHITHFFNAMSGLHHRDLGVVGWGLSERDVTIDLIADGIHVHPSMLEMALGVKGSGSVSLISDSIAPTGLGDGEYEVWGESISVSRGRTANATGKIAGSVIALDEAVRMIAAMGFSAEDASRMASTNPAVLLGVESDYGSIDVGKAADVIMVNRNMEIQTAYVGGTRI